MIIPIDQIGTWKYVLLIAQTIEINYEKSPNFCGKVTTLTKIDWLCFLNKNALRVNANNQSWHQLISNHSECC